MHTCQLSVLGEELLWTGPEQNHAVNHTTFRQPVDVSLRLRPPPLHWGRLRVLDEVGGHYVVMNVHFCLQNALPWKWFLWLCRFNLETS